MLQDFDNYNHVWMEVTSLEHQHGGAGWEYGSHLWSPTLNSTGADRYAIMRLPETGDAVIHLLHNQWNANAWSRRFAGYSFVAQPFQVIQQAPPQPGEWAGRPAYYRIDVQDYTPFAVPVEVNAFIRAFEPELRTDADQNEGRHYPFPRYNEGVRLVAGIYLARCTRTLFELVRRATGIQAANAGNAAEGEQQQSEYGEMLRMAKERWFFARNPQLARDAKARDQYTCQVCGFNFLDAYGQLGELYAECHHKDPLSERRDADWTQQLTTMLADVVTLCANCHRVVHRTRPARDIALLKQAIAERDAQRGAPYALHPVA